MDALLPIYTSSDGLKLEYDDDGSAELAATLSQIEFLFLRFSKTFTWYFRFVVSLLRSSKQTD